MAVLHSLYLRMLASWDEAVTSAVAFLVESYIFSALCFACCIAELAPLVLPAVGAPGEGAAGWWRSVAELCLPHNFFCGMQKGYRTCHPLRGSIAGPFGCILEGLVGVPWEVLRPRGEAEAG